MLSVTLLGQYRSMMFYLLHKKFLCLVYSVQNPNLIVGMEKPFDRCFWLFFFLVNSMDLP